MFWGRKTEVGRLPLNVGNTFQQQPRYKEPQGESILPACLSLLLVSASATASKILGWHQNMDSRLTALHASSRPLVLDWDG